MHHERNLLLEVLEWKRGLLALHARIGRHFGRAEPREQALAYLKGLLGPVERKNGWQIAEWLGDRTPDRVQRLLASAKWDADQVRDDLQAYVKDHLCDPQAILALDDTGFAKQGSHSVGVQRQYDPSTKEVDTCQVAVFLGYVSAIGATFLDRELYLPAEWMADPQRCQQAGIPAHVRFATKPQLARAMIERARSAGLPFAWIVADSTYGSDPNLRIWLEKEQIPHVMAVHSDEPVGVVTGQGIRQMRAAEAIHVLQRADWEPMSMGEGTKGSRVFDWARLPIERAGIDDQQHWLLMRRSLFDESQVTFYLVYGPRQSTLQQMVWVVGGRWKIEEILEAAKGEVGLDHYEVRLWTSWYRHITLCLLAHAYLTVMRAHGLQHEGTDPWHTAAELLPLTVAEVRHLLWQILWSRPPPLLLVEAWSWWRRRHQARAKRAHVRRRHQSHLQRATGCHLGCDHQSHGLPGGLSRETSPKENRRPRLLTVVYYVADQEYLLSGEQGTHSFCAWGSADWFATIEHVSAFRFCGQQGRFSVRKERSPCGKDYWYAYRKYHQRQHHLYLGMTAELSPAHLEEVAAKLQRKIAALEGSPPEI